MKILKFFKKNPEKRLGLGYLEEKWDNRNYEATEIYKSFPKVEWKEKRPQEWRRFLPIRFQNGAGSCVGHTVALMLGVENYLEEGKFVSLSARSIYARGFMPGGGMYYNQAMEIGKETGATVEMLLPSDSKTEDQMRDLSDEKEGDRLVGKIYRGGQFVYLPSQDIEAIAGIISTGKAVALGTRFNSGGFNNGEVILTPNGIYGHAVTGVDFTLWKGKKAIVFQNSWGESWGNFNGMGVITEDYFGLDKGCGVAVYYEKLVNQSGGEKPKLKIVATELVSGMRNGEVAKLQIMLQYLGFFPQNTECTGYFGGITRQAVKDFQKQNSLTETGRADSQTISSLNQKFA